MILGVEKFARRYWGIFGMLAAIGSTGALWLAYLDTPSPWPPPDPIGEPTTKVPPPKSAQNQAEEPIVTTPIYRDKKFSTDGESNRANNSDVVNLSEPLEIDSNHPAVRRLLYNRLLSSGLTRSRHGRIILNIKFEGVRPSSSCAIGHEYAIEGTFELDVEKQKSNPAKVVAFECANSAMDPRSIKRKLHADWTHAVAEHVTAKL